MLNKRLDQNSLRLNLVSENEIMKGQAIFSSVVIGLSSPSFALAKAPTPNFQSSLYQREYLEIAQRYLSYQYVSSRLYNSESRILSIAREYSEGQPVRWDSISVESTNNQGIKLNVHGKIRRKRRDPSIRIGLFLQRDSQGNLIIVDHDWDTSKSCRRICERRVREALQNLPLHFPRFQQVLNSILA